MAAKSEAAVAIVGGESLLGRELREVIGSRSWKGKIKMFSGAEEGVALTEDQGEATVLATLEADDLAAAKVVFLAGSPQSSVRAWDTIQARHAHPLVIDLAGGLEDRPEARLRAPMAEPPGGPAPSASKDSIQVIAHPAAITLALFLKQLGQTGTIVRAVIHIFEPASERGQRGLDELQKQTVALLSFQKLPKAVYDTQVSFNLLPRFGEEALFPLEEIEQRIERHLASLLAMNKAGAVPMPSLRLAQAPVFHGYSFSAWVQFETRPDLAALTQDLAGGLIEVRGNDVEPPSNVGAAGQSGITVGAIEADRNDPRACWFWLVADNLRMSADNAVEVALARQE